MRLTATTLIASLAACHDPTAPTGLCMGEATLTADGTSVTFDAPGCASLDLTALPIAEGSVTVSFDVDGATLTPHVTAGPAGGVVHGLALTGEWQLTGDAPAVWWRQGYQSWSWSGVLALGALELGDDGLPVVGGDGDAATFFDDTADSSWWLGLIGRDGGASLLAGALSATTTAFHLAAGDDTLWLVWGNRGDAISLAGGETVTLDPIRLAAGADPWALHTDYATAVLPAPRALPARPPVGWSSWTVWYEAASEDGMAEQLAAADALPQGLAPLDVVQIDDGWERLWGDWTANERFPSGMAAAAASIHASGRTAGLWMAPFYVDVHAPAYLDHPDWFVHNPDGTPILWSNLGVGPYAIVDATHPEAGPWMAQQVADRVAEGFTYLKLDFLYAGAQPGVRYADVTGMQAFHQGMELLREAAGDSWILACGAPMLPSVGYAESFRSGADIAFTVVKDPRRAFYRWQLRSTAARGWQNGTWWWIDPDTSLLRDPLDDAGADGALASVLSAGGAWLLGDDLTTLAPARTAQALNPELINRTGQRFVPQRPLAALSGFDPSPLAEFAAPDDHTPTTWLAEDGTTVLINLADEPVTLDDPGGVDLLTGDSGAAGALTLPAGTAVVRAP